jgi:hypothetical protein
MGLAASPGGHAPVWVTTALLQDELSQASAADRNGAQAVNEQDVFDDGYSSSKQAFQRRMSKSYSGADFTEVRDPRMLNPARADPRSDLIKELRGVAGWSKDTVSSSFDSMILDYASQGKDGLGFLATMLKPVAEASADMVSGAAGLGLLIADKDARTQLARRVSDFMDDPVGNTSKAWNNWRQKEWYDQAADVYKIFQGATVGIGISKYTDSVFQVGLLDDFSGLEPNSQKVLAAYQGAYDDAAGAFQRKLSSGDIAKPDRLNFNTWAGNRIDNAATIDMKAFREMSGLDELRVNQRLNTVDGIADYRKPDLFIPSERTVIDGTIGTKDLSTAQIQDFFNSGKVDRVILVSPMQKPITITIEQYRNFRK